MDERAATGGIGPIVSQETRQEMINIHANRENGPLKDYVDVYDKAQRFYARLAVESLEVRQQAEVFEIQGKALHQIKEFASVGFMSVSEATEEAFEQLWRKAFFCEPSPSGQTPVKPARRRSARDD
jgi:hypothetical protein